MCRIKLISLLGSAFGLPSIWTPCHQTTKTAVNELCLRGDQSLVPASETTLDKWLYQVHYVVSSDSDCH